MEKASSVLNALVKDLGLETKVGLYRIQADWVKIFREPMSLHSYPSGFSEGILQVNVDSPAWLQQLNFFKREMVKKLGDYGVRDIRFKLGRISPKTRTNFSSDSTTSLSDDDRSFIDGMVSRVGDELGVSIRHAMENWALKRRRK